MNVFPTIKTYLMYYFKLHEIKKLKMSNLSYPFTFEV